MTPKALRTVRIERGLSVIEFAALVGIGVDQLADIEKGRMDVAPHVALAVKSAIRQPADELLLKVASGKMPRYPKLRIR